MLNLLNNPTFDGKRNDLNADLFVSNLKNNLKAFGFNPKVTYKVYRTITIYHIKWLDDKDYNDLLKYKREIALSLGINTEVLRIEKVKENEVLIKVNNMKKENLCLKEVLSNFKLDDKFKIALGFNEIDELITYDFDKDSNLLVIGTTGSGKTNLFNNIIMNLLINYSDNKIIILDSQGINYNIYDKVCEVINKEDNIIIKLNLLRREFENRAKNGNRDKIIVFIDEIYEIIKLDSSVKDDINYLLEIGPSMGIYLVVSTDSVIDDDIYDLFNKDNLSKIVFNLTSREEYNKVLNTYINDKLGSDAIYINKEKDINRVSIPLVKDNEIEKIVSMINK